MSEHFLDALLGAADKSLGVAGATLVAASTYLLKTATDRVNKTSLALENHHERISKLELTYVSKADLEDVLDSLQRDLRGSFERAHSRIDELYKSPRKD